MKEAPFGVSFFRRQNMAYKRVLLKLSGEALKDEKIKYKIRILFLKTSNHQKTQKSKKV